VSIWLLLHLKEANSRPNCLTEQSRIQFGAVLVHGKQRDIRLTTAGSRTSRPGATPNIPKGEEIQCGAVAIVNPAEPAKALDLMTL
jgi:hypothetical protein